MCLFQPGCRPDLQPPALAMPALQSFGLGHNVDTVHAQKAVFDGNGNFLARFESAIFLLVVGKQVLDAVYPDAWLFYLHTITRD